jgi:predicted acetyltransferase
MININNKICRYWKSQGIRGVFRKAVGFCIERLWSRADWLVYEKSLTRVPENRSSALRHRLLEFDDLRRSKYFKAIECPEETRERLSGGAVCHGFFVGTELVTVGWSVVGRLELDVDCNIPISGAVGLYDFFTVPQFRSKGYYARALEYLLGAMFQAGFSRAYIAVDPGNVPSRKVIERVGFLLRLKVSRLRRFGISSTRVLEAGKRDCKNATFPG